MKGCSSPDELCRCARDLGYGSLVLADLDSLAGLWPFLAACKRYGITPCVAAEITDPTSPVTVVCLTLDVRGYANLSNLITSRKGGHFSFEGDIVRYSRGLVIISSSLSLLTRLNRHDIRLAANVGPRPEAGATALRKWARKHSVPAVLLPQIYMARQNEREVLELMAAIREKKILERNGVRHNENPFWMESEQAYLSRFAVWPEVIAATEKLVRSCHFRGPDFGMVMPPWAVGGETAQSALYQASYRGACIRYGTDLSEAVVERLEKELQVIESMGFSSYFLVVRDIVNRAVKKSDSSSKICGRGSGAASLVAYCLEITNVCPLKHNLYFERFLNPGRSDPPDIDIDFAWDERDGILAEVLGRYGCRAAMVATVIRFQPRMAIRETARAFGLGTEEIARGVKQVRFSSGDKGGMVHPWPEILELAARLIGIPRHLSVHPGGVIITPELVSNYVPIEPSSKGVPIIQWDKDGAEDGGLVKIDLLGNRSLGVIRDCIDSLAGRGRCFDEEYWQPEEDPETKKMVAAGRTIGCFYIESPAMRLLQQRAASGEFEQLVLQSSIIRPAANDFVREYIRRLHGGAWEHIHPKLATVLDETFGLMVYQEDVSRVAVALAGFSHSKADGLRKVMSKKDKVLRLQDYYLEFSRGCAEHGVVAEVCEKLWQMMMSFDGYSFCKPHSASYARVSYQAAYLKNHYPAEFMAAVLSNQGGYYSTFAYVSETKRLGVTVLPPCVNSSNIRWGSEYSGGEEKTIRVGLMAVKQLSAATMERIVACRTEEGSFISSADFWHRVQPHKDECRTLIQAGAMDTLAGHGNRSRLFWEIAQCRALAKKAIQSSLFEVQVPDAPELTDFTWQELQQQEYGALGFLCGEHPVLNFGRKLWGRVKACDMKQYAGKRIRFGGWLLTGKMVSTKTGEVMEFLTFEDETGLVEAIFFPKMYRRYAAVLSKGCVYMLQGEVEEEYGAVTLTVEALEMLGEYPLQVSNQLGTAA